MGPHCLKQPLLCLVNGDINVAPNAEELLRSDDAWSCVVVQFCGFSGITRTHSCGVFEWIGT